MEIQEIRCATLWERYGTRLFVLIYSARNYPRAEAHSVLYYMISYQRCPSTASEPPFASATLNDDLVFQYHYDLVSKVITGRPVLGPILNIHSN